jgi:hypothetical protein
MLSTHGDFCNMNTTKEGTGITVKLTTILNHRRELDTGYQTQMHHYLRVHIFFRCKSRPTRTDVPQDDEINKKTTNTLIH